jgi:hypothetical protein
MHKSRGACLGPSTRADTIDHGACAGNGSLLEDGVRLSWHELLKAPVPLRSHAVLIKRPLAIVENRVRRSQVAGIRV